MKNSSRVRFSEFLGLLVGRSGSGKPLTVQQLNVELSRRKGRPSGADDRASIYDRLKAKHVPNPGNAWLIGQAINACGVEWVSGLLTLYAAGHVRDFVGVLASIPREVLRARIEHVASLVQTAYAATYASPLEGELMRAAILAGADRKSVACEIQRKQDRATARSVWTLEPDLAQIIERASQRWNDPRERPQLPKLLQHASRIAKDTAAAPNAQFWLPERSIMQWLYTEIHPKPPDFGTALLFEALQKAPNSNLAELARLILASEYFAVQAEVAPVEWPSLEPPQTIAARNRKLALLTEQELENEDPMAWLDDAELHNS